MAENERRPEAETAPAREGTDERPAYEPPRIEKKRSVSRATLFTGSGPTAGGLTASG